MANESYCVSWWGDAPNTARSLEDVTPNCDLLGGQLSMQKRIESEGGIQESTYCASLIFNSLSNL